MSKQLTAYTLFAGAGGMHLGLEQAGFKVLVATDVSRHAAETHRRNWPKLPFVEADARQLSGADLLRAAGGKAPDLIAGGPPCQGFSTLGDKLSADPRNRLFEAFAHIVGELSPRFVLMENVKAVATLYQGRFRAHIIRTFEKLGYRTHFAILNAADYGVPQVRQRAIFFGTRHGAAFDFPAPTHGDEVGKPYRTAWQAIGDLAKKDERFPNHIVLDHSEKVIRRYKLIPQGGRLPPPEKLPKAIRRGNFGNTYKRLHKNRPSLTMVPGNNAFPVHPTLHRSLTPREAARIQSFPDSFVFVGDRRNQCILVGNAVPPLFAKALGHAIAAHAGRRATSKKSLPVFQPIQPVLPMNKPHFPGGAFVDLFCGAGGFTIGLERAGWKPVLGVDINKFVAVTHAANHPGIPFVSQDLASPEVRQSIEDSLRGTEVGLVVGGPPCQGFSVFGNRRFVNTREYDPHKDPRNRLVYAYVDMVKRLNPRWFVMENVPGLASLDGGEFLKSLVQELRGLGYPNAEAKILNAADYGVPQLRRRLLIIGNRTGHIIPWPKRKFFAEPREWQEPHRTVGEVLADLADEGSYTRHTSHAPMRHKPLLVERYKYIPEGGKLDEAALPNHLKKGYRTDNVKNYSHVFKRLHRGRPAPTMVPGHNAFPIHPWLNRALTVREAARIQTFPDDIKFCGPRQEQCIQVGNAFPPLLAEVLGNLIHKAERNAWYPGRVPASAYYALVEHADEQQFELRPWQLSEAEIGDAA